MKNIFNLIKKNKEEVVNNEVNEAITLEDNDIIQRFLTFLDNAVSKYHAVKEIEKQLCAKGFIKLFEAEKWDIKPNGKYYYVKNDSSILAFTIPNHLADLSLNIVASHTDSPNLTLKPNFELELGGKLKGLNTEVYGGTILSTWLDRPLGIAGRITFLDDDMLKTQLIDLKDFCVIPNVAIHQNRNVNDGYKFNPAIDMRPIYASKTNANNLTDLLKNIVSSNLLGYDLQLYNRERGILVGQDKEFIVAPQIDNLESVYLSLEAFLTSENASSINVYAAFDNEEVGSGTAQGAYSSFFNDSLKRLLRNLGINEEDMAIVFAKSFLVSCDNAHAMHPNNPSLCDKDNASYLNGGIVIKTNANQSYTTDAVSMAIFKKLLEKEQIAYQIFANRSDQRGGSTLGHLAVQKTPIASIDIGLAQLAMHSAMETAGTRDLELMVKGLKAFYNQHLTKENDYYKSN